MTITVAASRATDVERVELVLPRGATVADALLALELRHPGWWRVAPLLFGIDGRRATAADVLHPGDRLEFYRPLELDPKDARRQRAARQASGESPAAAMKPGSVG